MKKTIPTNIKYFEWLWLSSMIIGIISTGVNYQEMPQFESKIGTVILYLCVSAGILFLIFFTSRKANNITKRILTILFFLAFPLTLLGLPNLMQSHLISGLLSLGQLIMQIAAMCFLFTDEGRAYFKKTKN